ncbi:ATPase associated with various cellular activities AAA_5 [Methylobacterium sp. 4-46]|uniref:CbbQ/NirQ/NorQ/GpvN family protein n=1 Tax=unclassified Methylobacterium TaxID=2615210 RepID=UPI000152CC65|nr:MULTISPECIES: CbbQ/NirQ/NorQ/GpvN family protein [Methylobacterium]ACA15162.1 ATPase associated with various cellular activities AAA_5 [Methylobacterium sp. 4-46]WFT80896.1 CbbQ/NirQ/NorQ/GpvN family protein [Methylobacterium nodulans]
MLTDPLLRSEPYYRPVGDEVALFEAAYAARLPMILKGPTGCGKTRFLEHMAWRLGRPLVTVACHEDMCAADLVGRWLLEAGGTVWHDGPLTRAVRQGAICYLDEVVEARADTIVAIHPLADARRILPLERSGEVVPAHPDFLLCLSYNPGYQAAQKDLKESTKQRFGALAFAYPEAPVEAEIVGREAGIGPAVAERLVRVGAASRALVAEGLAEGASTRMLIHAGRLIAGGIGFAPACALAVATPLTDDPALRDALASCIAAQVP